MRPRNREINIFNLSMMDVISGALGAFLIIVIILFPYYKNDLARENRELKEQLKASESARAQAEEATRQAQQETEQAQQALSQSQSALQRSEQARQQAEQSAQQANIQLNQSRQTLKECREKLAKTFMVIVIKWQTTLHDVDLHVVDPAGAEFFYKRKRISGRPGELSEDDRIGPGNEVWEIRQAPPGKYKVYYNLYDRHGNSSNPVVTGRLFYRDGSAEFPAKTLSRNSTKIPVAIINVKENGDVEIQPM